MLKSGVGDFRALQFKPVKARQGFQVPESLV